MRLDAIRFCASTATYSKPAELLEALAAVSCKHPQRLGVVAAWSVPWRSYRHVMSRINRSIFFHPAFPGEEFWAAYIKLAVERDGSAIDDYGRAVSNPFTLTEAMHALRLTGPARWIFDLLHDFGIRDGLYCPFRRWMLLYSAERPLRLEYIDRQFLYMAANAAVTQMERLVRTPRRPDDQLGLTQREITVLRMRSHGRTNPEIAAALGGISPVTVRNHLTRAAKKLKAHDLAHAIAVAFRDNIIS